MSSSSDTCIDTIVAPAAPTTRPVPMPRKKLTVTLPPRPIPAPRVLPVSGDTVDCQLIKKCNKVDRWEGQLEGRKFTIYVPHTVISGAEKIQVTIEGLEPGVQGTYGTIFQLAKEAKGSGDDKYQITDPGPSNWGDVYLPQSYRRYAAVSITVVPTTVVPTTD